MRKLLLFLLFILVIPGLTRNPSPVHAQALPTQKICPPGETPFTPGGACTGATDYLDYKIPTYVLSCQDTPTARIKRTTDTYTAPGIEPVTVEIDISQAELGGLGPNGDAYQNQSSDYLSQYYPFNALFDKPLVSLTSPREQSQAFWRFTNSYQQANAKAAFLTQVRKNDPPINNSSIVFYSDQPPAGTTPTVSPTPPSTPTDKNYGFNWGYGHLDPKACADAKGRPVTFLVPLQAKEQQLKDFRDCYKDASMRIVRIMDFDGKTENSIFTTAGTEYQKVFADDYVELGNELNNLSLEYPNCGKDLTVCGDTYAKQFQKFRETFKGKLAGATLDTSNSDYDASKFLAGAISAYKQADFITSNSFKGAGGCGERCSEKNYLWVAAQIGTGKNIILTEYGLAPGTDTNLNDVVNFYKNNIPTDVLAVTPLVRNPCPGGVGEWLRMINYKFFDVESNLVNPDNCASSKAMNLYPDSMTYLDLDLRLPICLRQAPVCNQYLEAHNGLNPRIKAAYDALFPFNFDNVRGYQVMNDIVSSESLPYIQAIYQGLMDKTYGLANALSPQWLNDDRIKDLTDKQLYPPLKVPISWENNDPTIFPIAIGLAKTLDAGTCAYHNGIYLASPLTHPDKNLSQIVLIPYLVSQSTHTVTDPITGLPVEVIRYTIRGQAPGKPVAILNNPLLEVIDLAVYKSNQSLIGMLLPSFAYSKPLERDMVAPLAELTSPDDGITVKTNTLGVGHGTIDRLGGQTHWKLCQLRNQWLMPSALQDKTIRCDNMELQDMINGNTGVDIPTN